MAFLKFWGGAAAKLSRMLAVAASVTLFAQGAAHADALDDIKARGKLVVGTQADNPPWGIIDANGQNDGYDVDVARLMGKALGVPVEFVRVTSPNRIAQLQTGKVDVLIAVVGMYPDRAEVVQFSRPYSTLANLVIGHKATKITGFADLAGLTVGVCRGCNQDKVITENAPKDTVIRRFDDEPSNAQALLGGQVDAVGANTTFLPNIRKIKPDHDFEAKFELTRQWTGMAIRKGEDKFLCWINEFIDGVEKSGELNAISQKWLEEDLPKFPETVEGVPFACPLKS